MQDTCYICRDFITVGPTVCIRVSVNERALAHRDCVMRRVESCRGAARNGSKRWERKMGKERKKEKKKREVPPENIGFINCALCSEQILNIDAVSLRIRGVPISVCKKCYRERSQDGHFDPGDG